MKISDVIDYSLESITGRIKNAPSQKIAELASNNVLRSTFAITSTFAILTEELKKELIYLIQEISQTEVRKKDISTLRVKLNEFILSEFKEHERHLTSLNIFTKFASPEIIKFINKEIDDTKSSVELKLLILERKLSERQRQIYWDLTKIALSAIIGGVIGAYIKSAIGS
ncbi:hypothetical protein Q9R46_14620 [Paenibacillus sp. RRE4]|uniref:hypothetical protein n=1 Tax=Paenibacillus sp. RRE4 TaxID=2962587 RepID=UPI002882C4C0|nr:hypothetical protein [Paenibacillus sp. RRE4]MDT0123892.1 hypothetical protein [Paenibacillus sp. RRE4]